MSRKTNSISHNMRWLYLLCSSITLIGCGEPLPVMDREANRILGNLAKEMKKYHLQAIGFGGGLDPKNGKNLTTAMDFMYEYDLTIPIARRLIVEASETLLHLINSDPNNEKYFTPFPSTIDNVDVGVLKSHTQKDGPNIIDRSGVFQGYLSYDKGHLRISPITNLPVPLHEETYLEAKEILNAEKSLQGNGLEK